MPSVWSSVEKNGISFCRNQKTTVGLSVVVTDRSIPLAVLRPQYNYVCSLWINEGNELYLIRCKKYIIEVHIYHVGILNGFKV
jgi:hypothetical protein